MKILAGDIGGTNTRLAVLRLRAEGGFDELDRAVFRSRDFSSVEDVLSTYRRERAEDCEVASLGVAGPVFNRRCQATNLPWTIDADQLELRLGFRRVEILNDQEAQAHGLAALDPEQLLTLHAGEPRPGNAALIAAGTGLGQAGLYFDGQRFVPFATEGGHTDFAPRDEREFRLLCFLQDRFGRVSWERVLSGPGLVQLFDFMVLVEGHEPDNELRRRMEIGDPAAEISAAAMAGQCPAAQAALDLFVELLGSETANLALKLMARSGVFLGGGIAPKILNHLRHRPEFLDAFLSKGRMRPVLEMIPIVVVLAPNTALLGAAHYYMQLDHLTTNRGERDEMPPIADSIGVRSS
ncbi:MAG: glucokinase [Thermoanaerobaculia bacterium]|nr:glucokinase [Thermoanaerobaculia bacterium]